MRTREEKHIGLNIGSASIIMIFTIMCLTVFSVLSLVSAVAEHRNAERFAESTKAYYEADSEAMRIRNCIAQELSSGASPQKIAQKYGADYKTAAENNDATAENSAYYGIFSYYVSVSAGSAGTEENGKDTDNDNSAGTSIAVELIYSSEGLKTVKWQKQDLNGWNPDDDIELIDIQ